jgi:hypothetical protein
MIPITKTIDLLQCKPMMLQIKDNGKQIVKGKVLGFITKCSIQLGLSFDVSFMDTLAEDLIDRYTYESIEDIAECLKKGRQGFYGTSYNKLTMIVISDWMQKHLSDKSEAREKYLKATYQTSKEPLAVVDYEKYKERIASKKPSISQPSQRDLNEYIEKVCEAMSVSIEDLHSSTRVKEVADVRGLIKDYQKNVIKMGREQIINYWKTKD